MSTPDPPATHSPEARGFAGLAALVTDVAADVEGVEQSPPLPGPAAQTRPPVGPRQPTTIRQTGRTPIWARAAVVVLAAGGFVFGVYHYSSSSSSTGGTSSAASSARSGSTPVVPEPAPRPVLQAPHSEPLKAPVAPMGISTVTKPSTSDLILGVNELRWCLSQRVR